MKRVLVFGGSGFVGSKIMEVLRKEKFSVYSVSRSGKGKNQLSADITDEKSISSIIKKNDIVVNLVGLSPLRSPKGITYYQAHVEGVSNIISACQNKNCKVVHMSALGASVEGATEYLRTKGQGENLVLNSGLDATVICPSAIYDRGGELIDGMVKASKFRIFPSVPALMQPVYRGDIAKLFLQAVRGEISDKKVEVGGPQRMKLCEMACEIFGAMGKKCYTIPFPLVKTGVFFASIFGISGMNRDSLKNLTLDNTTDKKIPLSEMKRFSDWVKEEFS